MNVNERILCTLVTPEVEVVTEPTPIGYETRISGGQLDGDRFLTEADPDRQHRGACILARTAA